MARQLLRIFPGGNLVRIIHLRKLNPSSYAFTDEDNLVL